MFAYDRSIIHGGTTGKGTGAPFDPEGYLKFGGHGLLMNRLNQFRPMPADMLQYLTSSGGSSAGQDQQSAFLYFDRELYPAPLYSRRNDLRDFRSNVSPTGMLIKGVHYEVSCSNGSQERFHGGAIWEADRISGKVPFKDSYEEWAKELNSKYQNYLPLSEFKISNHVGKIDISGSQMFTSNMFELTGVGDSSAQNFYKVYSNSDFMRHFEIIQEDHRDFSKTQILTLKCRAVKKFLPYEGFYPCQRTFTLAEQFFKSYGKFIKTDLTGGVFSAVSGKSFNYPKQFVLQPLFAPGVLFNTIKSGVAVDYPVLFDDLQARTVSGLPRPNSLGDQSHSFTDIPDDDSESTTVIGGKDVPSLLVEHMITASHFHKRIPFEALIAPESFLAGDSYKKMEPHPSGNLPIGAVWNGGQSDNLYKMMAHNFLAEVPQFFLQDQNFTTIASLKNGDPNFGNVIEGNVYGMRLRMYRSTTAGKPAFTHPGNGVKFSVPQDTALDNFRETFTMYSRPSAFGPPTLGVSNITGSFGPFERPAVYYGPGRDDIHNHPIFSVDSLGDGFLAKGAGGASSDIYEARGRTTSRGDFFRIVKDSRNGYNFPYTPPYYHGEGWVDIYFTASVTGKMKLSEILQKSQRNVSYTRFAWDHYGYGFNQVSGSAYGSIPGANISETSLLQAWQGERNNQQFGQDTRATSPFYTGEASGSDQGSGTNNHNFISFQGAQGGLHLNNNAVQVSASLNLFSFGKLESVQLIGDDTDEEVIVATTSTDDDPDARWVIQTKFETPMLNFNNISERSGSLTIPNIGSESVPRGMWHQYGTLPAQNEGVFIQVGPIPDSWTQAVEGKEPDSVADLSAVCGFSTEPIKLGRVAEAKVISEAVVAIPFVQNEGRRSFFQLESDQILRHTRGKVALKDLAIGASIKQQIKLMKKFVLPPPFDFVTYPESVDPIAMYIFEFRQKLTQQDLANIWQNLEPDCADTIEESSVQITHPLLAKELLGGGRAGDNTPVAMDNKLKWMIFKAKQRAGRNYFDKVILKNTELLKSDDDVFDSRAQFNWPYDFCSIIELAAIDAEVEWSATDFSNYVESMPTPESYQATVDDIDRMSEIGDAVIPPPEPPLPPPEPEPEPEEEVEVEDREETLTLLNVGRYGSMVTEEPEPEPDPPPPTPQETVHNWQPKSNKTDRQNMKELAYIAINQSGGTMKDKRKIAERQVRDHPHFKDIKKMHQFNIHEEDGSLVFYYPKNDVNGNYPRG